MLICHSYIFSGKVSVQVFPHFYWIVFLLSFESFLYFLVASSLPHVVLQIFFPNRVCLFRLCLYRSETLNFDDDQFIIFKWVMILVSSKSLPNLRPQPFSVMFFSRSFIVLVHIFRSVIHLELVFI